MGNIVTFYSFKGGVGRSMALANAAVLLARWGYKTLVVDWDLEAPGLETFFSGYFKNPDKIKEHGGIVELLYSARERTRPADDIMEDADPPPEEVELGQQSRLEVSTREWQDYVVPVKLRGEKAGLHLLTAGRRDDDYITRVRTFDVKEFYREKEGGYFIEELRREWKAAYDFVLIDSRTGITDIGGICTIQFPDILVLLFTATKQGLEGAVDVAKRATAARRRLPFDRLRLLTIPVPSRFDRSVEYHLSDEWLRRFETEVKDLYADWLPKDIQRRDMLELTKIPYQAFFSFGEKLAVEEGTTLDPTGMGHAYETLTALIAHRLENAQRLRENRDEFVNRAAAGPAKAAVGPAKAAAVHGSGELHLAQELKLHKEWLASGGTEGRRADFARRKLRGSSFYRARLEQANLAGAELSASHFGEANATGADFSGANLQGANLEQLKASCSNFQQATLIDADLRRADLVGANLKNANMQAALAFGCDLRQANLEGANLSRCDLKGAQLRDATLENANAGDALGLTLSQLGGTNLSSAKLPEHLYTEEEINHVKRLTSSVHGLLIGLVAVCVYCIYVVFGETTNLLLVTDGPTSWLVLGSPLATFFVVAPVALFFLYFLFQYNLHSLWERLAELPAVFPDGKRLDEKISTWFITLTMRRYFQRLRTKTSPAALRYFFSFITWWLVPIVLLLFWLRYLPAERRVGTALHILLAAGAAGAAIFYRDLAVRTLRGEGDVPPCEPAPADERPSARQGARQ